MINRLLAKKSKVSLMLLAMCFLCSISIMEIYAQGTEVSVEPDTLMVGIEGQPIPTSPFTVNITVTNVTDLYFWQVVVYYDPLVVNYSAAWLPANHIFAGKAIVELEDAGDTPSVGRYVFYGCGLQGGVEGISASGTSMLCQMNFTAVAYGVTTLNISVPSVDPVRFATLLLKSRLNNYEVIQIVTQDAVVTVIPEFQIQSTLLIVFMAISIIIVYLGKRLLREFPINR